MGLLVIILSFLYGITGIIAMLGYIPTARDLTKRVASANIQSYIIWSFASGVGFLYALFVIGDFLLEIMTGLNFFFCALILLLSLRLKYA